jgi:alginate O-acetyltransferase complex protein AlgI
VVFSSPLFLFLFLPLVLAVYFALPWAWRNVWLLVMSLIFYGWGEPWFVLVMIASIIVNYALGLWVDRVRGRPAAWWVMALGVTLNIGLLAVYKYANFTIDNLNVLLGWVGAAPLHLDPVALPIGISFFTFQAFSYVIDVQRRDGPVQKSVLDLGLFVSLYPQLIAGPIVRYHDVAAQIVQRVVTREGFALGIERFLIGLGKKMLIANTVAVPADAIFAIPAPELTAGLAWLGILCYTLQIYFDFSGYSDMAIGLGHMLGFHFLENFNYPYISRSMTEFWRRWHISLSTWFRDYLYIPLGGNRLGRGRTYVNLLIVFFLCGLWHGAAWTFVLWGLFHGAFLVLERLGAGRWIETWPRPLRHGYVVLAVMTGWVLFRSPGVAPAGQFLASMFGLGTGTGLQYHVGLYWNAELALILLAGIVGSTPLLPRLAHWRQRITNPPLGAFVEAGRLAGLAFLLVASAMLMAAGTYNPFIYFRF